MKRSSSAANSSSASGLTLPSSCRSRSARLARFSWVGRWNGAGSGTGLPSLSACAVSAALGGTSCSGPYSLISVSTSSEKSSAALASSCSMRIRCSARATSSRCTSLVSRSSSDDRRLALAADLLQLGLPRRTRLGQLVAHLDRGAERDRDPDQRGGRAPARPRGRSRRRGPGPPAGRGPLPGLPFGVRLPQQRVGPAGDRGDPLLGGAHAPGGPPSRSAGPAAPGRRACRVPRWRVPRRAGCTRPARSRSSSSATRIRSASRAASAFCRAAPSRSVSALADRAAAPSSASRRAAALRSPSAARLACAATFTASLCVGHLGPRRRPAGP